MSQWPATGMLLFFVPNFQCDMSFDWKMFEVWGAGFCFLLSSFSIMFFCAFFAFVQHAEGHPFTRVYWWLDFDMIFFSSCFFIFAWCRSVSPFWHTANIYIIGWMLIVFLGKREDTSLCIPFEIRVIICQFVRTMNTGHRCDMHDLNIHLNFISFRVFF